VLIGTENSHFRKYLTTLGVSLVAGSISLGGLFFKIQADLLVERSKVDSLTPIAQETLRQRQQYLQWATVALPYVLGTVVVVGLAMVIVGLKGWARRQTVADSREEMEGRKLEVEIRQLTVQEKAEKVDDEARKAVEIKEPENVVVHVVAPISGIEPVPSEEPSSIASARESIRVVENKISTLLTSVFGDRRVTSDVFLQGERKYLFDVVVSAAANSPGYVFDIRYLNHKNNLRNRLMDAGVLLATGVSLLERSSGSRYVSVVVIVFEDHLYKSVRDDVGGYAQDLATALSLRLRVLAVSRRTLEVWTPNDLRRFLTMEELGAP
jgi:cell division protein FtsL